MLIEAVVRSPIRERRVLQTATRSAKKSNCVPVRARQSVGAHRLAWLAPTPAGGNFGGGSRLLSL